MAIKEIRAFILKERLNLVKAALLKKGVKVISTSKVRGYGEYANFFSDDQTTEHTCIDIVLPDDKVEEAVSAIIDAAHAGGPDDGIVVVSPIERVFRIRTKKELSQKEILGAKNNGGED